jgi:hypothetical protein
MASSSWTSPWVRGLGILLTVVLFAGCNGQSPMNGLLPKKQAPAGPMWEEPQFSAMRTALQKAVGGKKRTLSFSLTAESASIQVQDPAKPENVDAYEYRDGEVKGPTPVRLLGSGKLEDSLFDIDQVAIDRIPELAKAALQKLPLEGGKVLEVHVGMHEDIKAPDFGSGQMMKVERRIEMRVGLEGARRFGSVFADEKGNIVRASTA